MTLPANSLAEVLDYMARNEIDDDRIYAELEEIDIARAQALMKRLGFVEAVSSTHLKGARKRAFEGKRSRVKGKLYEALIGTIVSGVRCFDAHHSVQSTTNELDILVALGPRAAWLPALKRWGSHCICECKYHTTYVKTDWVTKLNTVLQTHSASVGILFSRKGIAPRGAGARTRHSLQLLAVSSSPRYIVCLSWDDLVDCTDHGKRFLKILISRYIEVQAGLDRLGLAIGA